LMAGSSNSLRRRSEPEACNASVLEKKRHGTAVRKRPVGAALTDGWCRPLRSNVVKGVVNASVPEKKRPGIVVAKGSPRGRDSLRLAAIHMKAAPGREAHRLGPKAGPGLDQRRPGNGFRLGGSR
jgi:hypothetical protein